MSQKEFDTKMSPPKMHKSQTSLKSRINLRFRKDLISVLRHLVNLLKYLINVWDKNETVWETIMSPSVVMGSSWDAFQSFTWSVKLSRSDLILGLPHQNSSTLAQFSYQASSSDFLYQSGPCMTFCIGRAPVWLNNFLHELLTEWLGFANAPPLIALNLHTRHSTTINCSLP